MKMHLWSAVAVSCLGICLVAFPVLARGEGGMTPQEAAGQLRNASKSELTLLKTALATEALDFQDSIASYIVAIGGATSTSEQGLENATRDLVDARNSVWDRADLAERNLEAFATGLLSGLPEPAYPLGFLLGDGQTLDRFVAAIEKETDKNRARLLKDMKKLARFLADLNYPINPGVLDLGATAPPAPNAGPLPVPKPTPLVIHGIAGGSSALATGDGKLCVGGIADPADGSVTVTIAGPGGITQSQTVTVGVDRKWYVCFPEVGTAGNLPEGNYTVEATQGAGSTVGAIGVPG